MNLVGLIASPLYWLAGKIFAIWARPVIQPDVPADLVEDKDVAICYVLETGGLADLLALERACAKSGLPSPTGPLSVGNVRESGRTIALRHMEGWFARRRSMSGSRRLERLIAAAGDERRELLSTGAVRRTRTVPCSS